MYEAIYGTSVPYLQGRTVLHKVYHVEPIVLMNPTQGILDRYNNTTLCCELMHINSIGLLNNISRHILFSTVSMIKNRKVKKIEYGINQVNKLYLHSGLNIDLINSDGVIPEREWIKDS